ncbi:putative methyltransferase DDB_G0268948 [Dermacentor silvarum]|uniref:putative methyltransferase DDB_G0268948 n=1 Tax=Dermacentor silvarum TaxID=543639 RepID=UPI0021012CAE|nr:putative methyltransferase DDB_G0268948 [Dermacentor silvarum]
MLLLRALWRRNSLLECIRTRRQVTRGLEDESPRDKYDLSVDGTDLSKLYKQARPTLPDFVVQDVIAYVNQKLPKRELCIDVGCGPGQSTELFCPYFKNVVGADISHSQIEEANAMRRHGNVTYMEAHAECLPLRSNSVALVSAVNAIQWFDQDAFFAEVRRVLVQNGVLFAAMHHLRALLEPGMDNWLSQLRRDKFSDYLLSRHMYWDEGYGSIKVPFKGVRRKTMLNNSTLTVSDVMSHINTWSLVIMMREQEPARAKATLAEFRDRILSKIQRYPEEDPVLNVAFMTSYVMCRK